MSTPPSPPRDTITEADVPDVADPDVADRCELFEAWLARVSEGANEHELFLLPQGILLCVEAHWVIANLGAGDAKRLLDSLGEWVRIFELVGYHREEDAPIAWYVYALVLEAIASIRGACALAPELCDYAVALEARLKDIPHGDTAATELVWYRRRVRFVAGGWGLRPHEREHIETCLAEVRTYAYAYPTEMAARGLALCARLTALALGTELGTDARAVNREVTGLLREARQWARDFMDAFSVTVAASRDLWIVYALVRRTLTSVCAEQSRSHSSASSALQTQVTIDTLAIWVSPYTRYFRVPGHRAEVERYADAIAQIARDHAGVASLYE
jgi:hypothetical protein